MWIQYNICNTETSRVRRSNALSSRIIPQFYLHRGGQKSSVKGSLPPAEMMTPACRLSLNKGKTAARRCAAEKRPLYGDNYYLFIGRWCIRAAQQLENGPKPGFGLFRLRQSIFHVAWNADSYSFLLPNLSEKSYRKRYRTSWISRNITTREFFGILSVTQASKIS